MGLGLTWLATVPPTAAIVGKLFGIRYLSTLFGLTLLSHQIGGFLGAYLGGLVLVEFGDYQLDVVRRYGSGDGRGAPQSADSGSPHGADGGRLIASAYAPESVNLYQARADSAASQRKGSLGT